MKYGPPKAWHVFADNCGLRTLFNIQPTKKFELLDILGIIDDVRAVTQVAFWNQQWAIPRYKGPAHYKTNFSIGPYIFK